jgi:hypothetical protein
MQIKKNIFNFWSVFLVLDIWTLTYYSIEIALTGQLVTASLQSQPAFSQSSPITWDFPSSTLNIWGQSASQVPHPMQISSLTFGFGIIFLRLFITA